MARQWRKVGPFVRRRYRSAVAAGSCIVVSSAIGTLTPILTGRTIDAISARNPRLLVLLIGAQLLIVFFNTVLGFVQSRYSIDFSQGFTNDLRLALADRLRRARLKHLASIEFGQIANRIDGDVQSLSQSISASVPVFASAMNLLWLVVALPLLNWRLAIVGYIFAPIWFWVSVSSGSTFAPITRRMSILGDHLYGVVSETLRLPGILRVKNFVQYDWDQQKLRNALTQLSVTAQDINNAGLPFSIAQGLLSSVAPAAVLGVGAWLVFRGEATVGTIVAFSGLMVRFYGPIMTLANFQSHFISMGAILDRVIEMLEIPTEEAAGDSVSGATITADAVSFSYRDEVVLSGVNLTIPPGSSVLVSGPSGCGKTTLARLLVRFYEPDSGRLSLDGIPMQQVKLDELRRTIIYVPQEAALNSGTLRENLLYGSVSSSDAEMREALSLSELSDYVATLPAGLDTRLGPDGMSLSAGQAQRVAIAQALLARPKVLILDEATNALDVETENAVLRNIRRSLPAMTLVLIAHKPPAELVFEQIIDLGSHPLSPTRT